MLTRSCRKNMIDTSDLEKLKGSGNLIDLLRQLFLRPWKALQSADDGKLHLFQLINLGSFQCALFDDHTFKHISYFIGVLQKIYGNIFGKLNFVVLLVWSKVTTVLGIFSVTFVFSYRMSMNCRHVCFNAVRPLNPPAFGCILALAFWDRAEGIFWNF